MKKQIKSVHKITHRILRKVKKHKSQNLGQRLLIVLLSFLVIIIGRQVVVLKVSPLPTPRQNIQTQQTDLTVLPPQNTASDQAKLTNTSTKQLYLYQQSGNSVRVPVLYYHYVGNNPNPQDHQRDALSITPDKFHEQMQFLATNGYHAISYDTLYAILNHQTAMPSKPVILTFDDGYVDFFYNAYPILQQFNLRATVFIPTGLIGRSAYLNWDQIHQMQHSQLISFEAHSVNHYNLTAVSTEVAKNEITESKKTLEQELGTPVNFMAYPYGATNNQIIQMVREAGYVGAIGTWASNTQSEGTRYNLPRIRVSGTLNIQSFQNLL
ncbi:polysaccharide deacetylase family protein [Patescibacteria group bacterium]|nr:polysaccharide deacetylase family protein [Patescibacteria group bacterium]